MTKTAKSIFIFLFFFFWIITKMEHGKYHVIVTKSWSQHVTKKSTDRHEDWKTRCIATIVIVYIV